MSSDLVRPKISVCVPCFEYAHFMSECLDSVLAQDFEDFELLLADNASSDDTEAIGREYAHRDRRIRYSRNETNLGYARNVNRLLEEARGEYVTILGCDDRYLDARFLSEAVRTLDSTPRAAFFHSAYREVDEEGAALRTMRYYDEPHVLSGRDELRHLLGLRYVWISTAVVRADAIQTVGGFDLAHEYAWDLGWFLRLCGEGDVCYSPRASVTYRQHRSSLSGSVNRAYKNPKVRATLEIFLPELSEDSELQDVTRRSIALLAGPAASALAAVPEPPGTRLRELCAKWRADERRVLVYGAGMHTRELVDAGHLRSIDVIAFADRDPMYRDTQLLGHPIVPPEGVAAQRPDVVLISSRFYQDEIYRDLRASLPETVHIERLYAPTAA